MARIVHLHLDAGPMGPALVQVGAQARVLTQILRAAVALLQRRLAAPELEQLDDRLLQDIGLHREGRTIWRHLDSLAPRERGRIVRGRY